MTMMMMLMRAEVASERRELRQVEREGFERQRTRDEDAKLPSPPARQTQ
jgi:hypothetical protein